MKKALAGIAVTLILLLLIGIILAFTVKIDSERLTGTNRVLPHEPFQISPEAEALHASLRIADWHTDSLMWLRSLLQRSDIGQVDFPRLVEGNVAIQVFTSVTRVPEVGIQVEDNPGKGDQITQLAFWDKWPSAARKSLFQRAKFHADKLHALQEQAPDKVRVIHNQAELAEVMSARAEGSQLTGAILGTEGLHPLEGDLSNLKRLYDEGFRIMGLFHFFDNELGGSLHGVSDEGLTEFGREVLAEMVERDIIIDVAHASPAAVREILELSPDPVILSHTGMRGVCDSARNLPDELMLEITKRGGLLGIGYFEIAICEMTAESVVDHLRYAVDLVGVDHVSLGSDYDGSVDTPFDVSEVAILTELMLQRGFSETEIRAIMGENILRFLDSHLPKKRG